MSYDTGANCLLISKAELPNLIPHQFYQYLSTTQLRLANGSFAFTHFIPGIQARVLNPDHMSEVGSWKGVSAVELTANIGLDQRFCKSTCLSARTLSL